MSMNIGEAAAASGVSAKMIRHYESVGLLTPVGRTDAGYRLYNDASVHTLLFIRRARRLDFPLERIRDLLELWQNQERASGDVYRIASIHLERLEDQAKALDAIVDTLRQLVTDCAGDDRPDCPILDDLAELTVDEKSDIANRT